MWNGHRMLRHRGHRDELTADLLSKRRDNYPGNFICLPRFLPSSKYFQSLLDDRLSSFFCFLFVSSSSFSFLLLARRQYSASHSPSFKFSYWFLPLFFFFFFFFFPSPFFLLLVASSSMIILGRRGNVSYDWQLHFSTRASFVANNGGVSFSWKIVGRLEMTGIFHEGVARANNWLLVVSRSKGSPWRERLMRFFRFTWYGLVRMLEMNF